MSPHLGNLARAVMVVACGVGLWSLGAVSGFAEDNPAAFSQALEAFRAGQNRKAATLLETVLKEHPDHAPSHELLGLSLSALGEESEALRHLREATILWPDQPVYWINLAVFYLRQSRAEEAEKALNRSLDVQPSAHALRLLALIRMDQNAVEDAAQLLRKALGLAPDAVESWYYLGLAQQSLAHSEEALRCYEEALKRAPGDFYTHLQIGTVLLNLGRRREALDHLLAAQALRPEYSDVYQRLSEAYLGSGDLDSALKSARRAVERIPKSREAHYQLGLVLARLGKRAESQKEFALSEAFPTKPETTPLERWRTLQSGARRTDEAKP
jgi:tetratricopeptide (TPR) repeat protein